MGDPDKGADPAHDVAANEGVGTAGPQQPLQFEKQREGLQAAAQAGVGNSKSVEKAQSAGSSSQAPPALAVGQGQEMNGILGAMMQMQMQLFTQMQSAQQAADERREE